MTDFFRFPHTPHLAWLGKGIPRDDKVLSEQDAEQLLSTPLYIEEKLDGANLGISLDNNGNIKVQNRGQYLIPPFSGQFSRLNAWLSQHRPSLTHTLGKNLIIFGEWCAAKHSLTYHNLPDWFVVFDVYDRNEKKFWNVQRRNAFAHAIGLAVVRNIFHGITSHQALIDLLSTKQSCYHQGAMEGLILRNDSAQWCESRAKLVSAEFTQTINTHWSKRSLEWNRVTTAAPEE